MPEYSVLIAAFTIGLLGAGHCFGMCGGIISALSFAVADSAKPSKKVFVLLGYNIGRLLGYAAIAALLAGAGSMVLAPNSPVLRLLAGVLLIAMGLYLADWWQGLTYLEKAGQKLWRFIQPLSNKLMPVTTGPQAILLGFLWGWLPCGLVYSALAYAVVQSDPLQAAVTMIAFGCGTLPFVLAGGFAAEKIKTWLGKKTIRAVMGLSLMIFGLWTLQALLGHGH